MKLQTIVAAVVATALLVILFASGRADAAFPNLNSKIASSTSMTVGTTPVTVFSERANCASRVVSTAGQAIMLSFDANRTPSATVGHYQGASTSVAYESDIYGCGAVTVYGHNASTTITRSEFAF